MAILVAYATAHGSTRGIAERIAARLTESGLPAEARDVREDLDVGAYDAFVLGSAVHNQKWLPEAGVFVRRHRAALASRPLWLFSVSSIGDEESFIPGRIGQWLSSLHSEPREVARYHRALRARAHRNFAGAVEREHWGIAGAAFLVLLGGSHGDHRNWPAIDTWAASIAAELGAGPAE